MSALYSITTLIRRATVKPVRALLIVLQVLLSTVAITAALSAYRASVGAGVVSRFDVLAATEEGRTFRRYPLFEAGRLPAMLELAPSLAVLSVFEALNLPSIMIGEDFFQLRSAAAVSPEYFFLSEIEIIEGAVFTRQDVDRGERLVVLSQRAAQDLFSDGDAVGRSAQLMPSRQTYTVVGVFRASRDNADTPTAFFTPEAYGARFSRINVLARPGESAAAREQILSAARNVYRAELATMNLEQGQDFLFAAAGNTDGRMGSSRLDLLIFSLFGIASLAVGSIGIFSMAVASAVDRQREIGIRRALGATPARIGAGFMAETGTLAVIGSALGVGLAYLAMSAIPVTATRMLFSGQGLSFDPGAALIAVGAIVFVSCALGLIPAYQASRLSPVEALREA